MKNYDELKKIILDMFEVIGADQRLLPGFDKQVHECEPYIFIDDRSWYHLKVEERGQTITDRIAFDLEHLLYMAFEYVTFDMATKFELEHRNENADCRRMIFAKQEEFLSKLNPAWAQRKKAEHATILWSSPFKDFSAADESLAKDSSASR